MTSKKRGRPKGSAKSTVPLLVPKTDEMKLEEAKEAVMEKMLKQENITPETMPNFASLDSYVGAMEPETPAVEPAPEAGAEAEDAPSVESESESESESVEVEGDYSEIDQRDDYVEIAPAKPKPKGGNFENLKIYNKIKEEKAELERRLASAEENLETERSEASRLKDKSDHLEEELRKARSEIDELRTKVRETVQKSEYDKVTAENDELLLKNSELELENSILKESSSKRSCEKATQPFTYSRPGYSSPASPIRNTRPSMNGYEDWI